VVARRQAYRTVRYNLPHSQTMANMMEKETFAQHLKEEGNRALKEGSLGMAILKYTEAISLDNNNATFYANRSMAYLKQDNLSAALEDAKKSVEIDVKYSKGYFRCGEALLKLQRLDEAAEAFAKASSLKPSDSSIHKKIKQVKNEKLASVRVVDRTDKLSANGSILFKKTPQTSFWTMLMRDLLLVILCVHPLASAISKSSILSIISRIFIPQKLKVPVA